MFRRTRGPKYAGAGAAPSPADYPDGRPVVTDDRAYDGRYDEDVDERPRRPLGLTRGVTTLLAAAVAGFLIYLASYMNMDVSGEWWAAMGILAGAGLVMALSQLLGGWTKWGVPHISAGVFGLAFVPVAIVVGWILLTTQPDGGWQQGRFAGWSGNLGILDLVRDLGELAPVLAFGLGLTFGFTFDTTGPRRRVVERRTDDVRRVPADDDRVADEPTTAERRAVVSDRPVATERTEGRVVASSRSPGTPAAPQPEPPPRASEPD